MRLLLTLLAFVSFSFVFSQNIDSLKNILNENNLSDKDYFKTLNELQSHLEKEEKEAYYKAAIERFSKSESNKFLGKVEFMYGLLYQYSNRDSALFHYGKAIEIIEGKDPAILGSLYNNAALLWYDYKDTSLQMAKRSLEYRIQSEDSLEIAYGHMLLADLYDESGIYFKGIEHYLASLEIYKHKEHLAAQIIAENNIAYLYGNIGQPEKEIEFTQKCIQTIIKSKDLRLFARATIHLGDAYSKNNQHEKGIETIMSIMPKVKDKPGQKAEAYAMLANIYNKKGDYKSSIGYAKLAKTYYLEKKNVDEIMKIQLVLSASYNKMNEFKLAKQEALEAETKAVILDNHPLLKDIYKELAEAHSGLGDFPQAYDYLNKHLLFKKEYEEKENKRLSQEISMKFEREIADLEIQNLQIERDLKEAQLKNEKDISKSRKRIILFITGGLILALLAIFFAVRGFIQKKKSNKIILEQKQEVEEKNNEIMDSITYAKRIQSAILPPDGLIKEHLPNSFVLYKPKDIVAGDFYWMEVVSDSGIKGSPPYQGGVRQAGGGSDSRNHPDLVTSATPPSKGGEMERTSTVLIAAADCTGHGVPGAMVSVVCNNGLNRSVREHGLTDPGKILDKTREIVIQEFEKSEEEVKDGMDIALVSLEQEYGARDSVAVALPSKLKYAGAHNPLWIVNPNRKEWPENMTVFKSGGGAEIRGNKQPIGKFSEPKPFDTHHVELVPGDKVYLFTDGYADQFGGSDKAGGKKFKSLNFKKLLVSIYDLSMEEQKAKIDENIESWRGEIEQIDDICIIGLSI